MFTILIPRVLLRPGFRVVILILVIVAVCRFAPGISIPVGFGSCLGWLAGDRAGVPGRAAVLAR
jgi:hypothetical protein